MELRKLENVKGITGNKEKGYIIQENKKFSEIVYEENIVIAFSEEKKEIVVYNKELEVISKESSYKFKVEKYELSNSILWRFGTNKIMIAYDNEKVTWIEIPLHYIKDSVVFDWCNSVKVFYIGKRSFIMCEYHYRYDNYTTFLESVIFELRPIEKEKLIQLFGISGNCSLDQELWIRGEYSSRFLTIKDKGLIYDLFTGRIYIMSSKIKSEEDLKVCYSSKEIIIIQNINCMKYYLYIKGKCIYEYNSEEENKKVMFNLKENRTVGEKFSTLPVGNNLCIWSKTIEPELINLIFKSN